MVPSRKRPLAKFMALVVIAMIIILAHDGNWLGVLVFGLLGGMSVWALGSPHRHNRH